eukprot:2321999-Rhodomonas_salina.5
MTTQSTDDNHGAHQSHEKTAYHRSRMPLCAFRSHAVVGVGCYDGRHVRQADAQCQVDRPC